LNGLAREYTPQPPEGGKNKEVRVISSGSEAIPNLRSEIKLDRFILPCISKHGIISLRYMLLRGAASAASPRNDSVLIASPTLKKGPFPAPIYTLLIDQC
jgi:hypothetical protein